MKAWRIHAHGDTGVAQLDTIDVPEPEATEVLIRVAAASVNPLDIKLMSGAVAKVFPIRLPYTLGTDVAGIVEQAGSLVTHWKAGDRVMLRLPATAGGAFAEFAVASARHVARIPDPLSFVQAASLPTAAGTAWQALFESARLRAGQTVLVHAGSGGVGSFAIQFAKAIGARVIATASGDGLLQVRELGADEAIDYRQTDFRSGVRDADVVLDTVGGEVQQRSFDVIRRGGVLVSLVSPPADPERIAQLGVTAVRIAHETVAARLDLIASLCAQGRTTPLVDRNVSFNELPAALARTGSGRARGKVVVTLS